MSSTDAPRFAFVTLEDARALAADAVREAMQSALPEAVRRAALPPYLSAEAVMQMTGWSLKTLARLRKDRKLEYASDGRRHVYPTEAVLDYLDARRVPVRWTADEAGSKR